MDGSMEEAMIRSDVDDPPKKKKSYKRKLCHGGRVRAQVNIALGGKKVQHRWLYHAFFKCIAGNPNHPFSMVLTKDFCRELFSYLHPNCFQWTDPGPPENRSGLKDIKDFKFESYKSATLKSNLLRAVAMDQIDYLTAHKRSLMIAALDDKLAPIFFLGIDPKEFGKKLTEEEKERRQEIREMKILEIRKARNAQKLKADLRDDKEKREKDELKRLKKEEKEEARKAKERLKELRLEVKAKEEAFKKKHPILQDRSKSLHKAYVAMEQSKKEKKEKKEKKKRKKIAIKEIPIDSVLQGVHTAGYDEEEDDKPVVSSLARYGFDKSIIIKDKPPSTDELLMKQYEKSQKDEYPMRVDLTEEEPIETIWEDEEVIDEEEIMKNWKKFKSN